MKYIDYVREDLSGPDFPIFRVSDLKIKFKGKGLSDSYIHLMLHNLEKRGEIIRITRGVYSFHDDSIVVGFAFAPFYYGMESALSIKGVSGQGFNYIIVTPRNVRAGTRRFKGRNYLVQRIKKEHMFGYDLTKSGKFWIPASDNEKSFIDILYFREGVTKELLNALAPKMDRKKLIRYLGKYDSNFARRVMDVYESGIRQK